MPNLETIRTDFQWPLVQNRDYTYMLNDLAIDEDRNNLIAATYNLRKEYHSKTVVFLCSLRSQVYKLWNKLNRDGGVLISPLDKNTIRLLKTKLKVSDEEIQLFNSFSKPKHRVQVISDLKSGKLNKIFATYSLFNKGIDIDLLEILFMCGPTRARTRILQSRGRIMRKRIDGKQKDPHIIFFLDHKIGVLAGQGSALRRALTVS